MKPYCELHIRGDAFSGGFTCGMTHCMTASTQGLSKISEDAEKTVYRTSRGHSVTQYHIKDGAVTRFHTEFENTTDAPVTLDMLSSFALQDIKAEKIYRMESFWSAEGRLKVDSLIDLDMECSWTGGGPRVLRFGSVGSMPVRQYFPFLALEETNGHFIGVQLYAPSSWQLEILCYEKGLFRVSGGQADRDFGAWFKVLAPGERFVTNEAVIAEAEDFLSVCDALVKAQSPDIAPEDRDMPVMFNEYCSSWGNPSEESLKAMADRLSGLGFRYLVMDAGWYRSEDGNWAECSGDWIPSRFLFPSGLKATCDYIREKGMIPGIWFEMETAGPKSRAYRCLEDHFLTRDGYFIEAGGKRFWDMEDPAVIDHLTRSVIDLLKDNGFGYMKLDYNDTIGPGCDGYESDGEGVRRKVLATQAFIRKMKESIPGIVLECCSSGGHRTEPSMMSLFSQSSITDAHECTCIPLIAANLQRVSPPCQNQIWCSLRAEDSRDRTVYSIVNTFLGRMCVSGDVHRLNEEQMALLKEGIAFYHRAADIIKNGKTVRIETNASSYLNPEGYQIVQRVWQGKVLTVAHKFANAPEIPEPKNVTDRFGALGGDFTACAWIHTEGE